MNKLHRPKDRDHYMQRVAHVTDMENLYSISNSGFQKGVSGHAWLGTGVYFNDRKTPFASMGPRSALDLGKVVIYTTLDTRGFVKVKFDEWKEIEEKIIDEIKAGSEYDPTGRIRSGKGKKWVKAEASRRQRAYWNRKLSTLPGAILEFPEMGADKGRIFVVRDVSRIGRMLVVQGAVYRSPNKIGPGMWMINCNISGVVITEGVTKLIHSSPRTFNKHCRRNWTTETELAFTVGEFPCKSLIKSFKPLEFPIAPNTPPEFPKAPNTPPYRDCSDQIRVATLLLEGGYSSFLLPQFAGSPSSRRNNTFDWD